MKTNLLILILATSFHCLSAANHKDKKCDSQKELNKLTLVLTKYGNNPEGVPPLIYAVIKNDVKVIDLLLKHGADPKTLDAHQRSCVYYAIKTGNIQLIKRFVALGNSLNSIRNKEEDTIDALNKAIEFGQYEATKHIITSGLLYNDILEKNLHSIFHPTFCKFTSDQRKSLLQLSVLQGADINAINEDGTSLLGRLPFLGYEEHQKEDLRDFLLSLGAVEIVKHNPT